MRYACLIALTLIPAALVAAQETPPEEKPALTAEQMADQLLSQAILGLRNKDELCVRARIKHQGAESQGGIVAGAVIVQVGGRVTSGGPGFEGEVDAWRDAKGDVVVQSVERLPGFSLFIGKGRSIREATYESGPPLLHQIEAELVPLLDTTRFLKYVMQADLVHGRDPDTGDFLFRGETSKDVVNVTRNAAGMFSSHVSRVLRTELRFAVSTEGVLKRTEITVVRNDPMAEMRRRGGGVRIGGAAPPPPQPKGEGGHDVEGGSTTYTLDYSHSKPSERAVEFLRRMRRLVGSEEQTK